MKKRTIFVLICLAAFLILGVTANLLTSISFENETYLINIKYTYESADYVPCVFDTYLEEHAAGEHISIVSPDLEGFKPEIKVFDYTVTSDLSIVINYTCIEHHPIIECDRVISYPTKGSPGVMERYCDFHRGLYLEEFTSITRTFTFGGESIRDLSNQGQTVDGYKVPWNSTALVLLKENIPELDIIFDGIPDFSGSNGLSDAATVEISYDKSIWNNEDVVYKRSVNLPIIEEAEYAFRFGDSWRIIFGYEGRKDGNIFNFVFSDDCPLITAPLTITLTYDYTK